MTERAGLSAARLLALVLPAALLAGAWSFQLLGGLPPCELCHWQRWPLYAALVVAAVAIVGRRRSSLSRALVSAAGLLIIVSGALAVLHVGVERHWWAGPTRCGSIALGGGDPLKAILASPVIRCDAAAWSLFGVSLAGWNALFSLAGGIAICTMCLRPRP